MASRRGIRPCNSAGEKGFIDAAEPVLQRLPCEIAQGGHPQALGQRVDGNHAAGVDAGGLGAKRVYGG